MYAIQEPTLIIYRCGETEYTANAEEGDVVCILYHEDFKKEVIVIKNDELYDNLIDKHARDQQEKERWAKQQVESKNCKCDENKEN